MTFDVVVGVVALEIAGVFVESVSKTGGIVATFLDAKRKVVNVFDCFDGGTLELKPDLGC